LISISVVIPTRNRPESLLRTLHCLVAQTYALQEIIVVDSSDESTDLGLIFRSTDTRIEQIVSRPSVCLQRNIGIAASRGEYVFLCDDDIDLPQDYVATLAAYISDTGATAVSGLVHQKGPDGEWVYQYPVGSFRRQLLTYVFQLGAWGSMRLSSPSRWTRFVSEAIAAHYERRGNDLSLAGWPTVTQFDAAVIRTRVYGLGASIVQKSCFDSNGFDETLDPHGFGDNYGVAMGLAEKIHVLKSAPVWHHESSVNRLPRQLAAYRRTLALHYFLTLMSTRRARVFLVWSLIGMALVALPHDRLRAKAAAKAILLICTGLNPYLAARKVGRKFVEARL